MDPNQAGNGVFPPVLSAEGLSKFEEGVGLILSSWIALQMAVQNEWGGRDSRQKEQKFAADIVSWLTRSTETRYIDELEEMLDENMVLSFSTETEDGSLEEVAEQVMLLHEECLQGNYDMVSKLQIACSTVQPASQCQKLTEEDSEDQSSGEEGEPVSEMEIDLDLKQQPEIVETVQRSTAGSLTEEEKADGWSVVQLRRRQSHRKS
jgi:pre-rRNA-processing protein TSR2